MKKASSLDTRQPELILFWYDLCVCRLVGLGGRSLLCEDWVITQCAAARVGLILVRALCVCRLVQVGRRSLLCNDWVITQYVAARVGFILVRALCVCRLVWGSGKDGAGVG